MNNPSDTEIQDIMGSRRNRFNKTSQEYLNSNIGFEYKGPGGSPNEIITQVSSANNEDEKRNDNDLDIVERETILKDNEFMNEFRESYYLENTTDEELIKKKALDLETLIVERLARDKIDDANRIFSVLKKLYNKYDSDSVKDIYFRVLNNMPKEKVNKQKIYSYRQDKNNFKDILDNLEEKKDIKAFNEDSPCVNGLSSMWEICDLDICSDKCKREILNTKQVFDNNEECKDLITGYDDDKKRDLTMEDDIKDVILERLRYCKKITELKKKDNLDQLSYKDVDNLKNKVIDEIYKMADLANLHYSSCLGNASEFFVKNQKYATILKLLKDMDYRSLSLERLQDIRNSLTLLPTCDTLNFREHDKKRDKYVKDGIRVGKYIIPKNTDYYNQIEGKDKPNVYRDLVSNKTYLYDPFSKTLTGLKYPMTKGTNINNSNISDNTIPPSNSDEEMNNLENKIEEELKLLNTVSPSPSTSKANNVATNAVETNTVATNNVANNNVANVETNTNAVATNAVANNIIETRVDTNNNNINNESEEDNKILFNLTLKDMLEYLFLCLLVVIIIVVFSLLL